MSFPPEVYSRCLLGDYGYPLWTPQLNVELCESYQLEGLKIGDVGILSPNNGNFDVLFNITLPRDEQPYPELVGAGFTPVTLNRRRDLNTEPDAIPAEYVFPRGSVQLIPAGVRVHSRNQKPSRARYEFSLSTENGAVLILPEGADKCDLKNERTFLDEAIRHGVSWYECATDPKKAGRLINNDSLYLVTGFHKARSWSLGATDQNSSTLQNQCSLTFEVEQIPKDSSTARAYHWAVVQGFMGRVGPLSPYEIPRYITDERRHGINQTVFIRGFRITVNRLLLLFKTVSVETSQGTFGGVGAYVNNLLRGGPSESTPSSGGEDATDNEVNQDFQGSHSRFYAGTRMTIDRVPDVSQTFHPGDLINRYMLKKEPRAILALTHDSLWIEMLQLGLLELADFSREQRLEEVMSRNYQIIMEDGAAYLQKGLENISREQSEPASPSSALTTPSTSTFELHSGHAEQHQVKEVLPVHISRKPLLPPPASPTIPNARSAFTSKRSEAITILPSSTDISDTESSESPICARSVSDESPVLAPLTGTECTPPIHPSKSSSTSRMLELSVPVGPPQGHDQDKDQLSTIEPIIRIPQLVAAGPAHRHAFSDEEREAKITALENELARVRAELDQRAQHSKAMEGDDASYNQQAGLSSTMEADQALYKGKGVQREEGWVQKQRLKEEERDIQMQELMAMVSQLLDEQAAARQREEDQMQVNEAKAGAEEVIEQLLRQNAEQRVLLNTLTENSIQQHEAIIGLRAVVNNPSLYNVKDYTFSGTPAAEIHGDVGKLRQELRNTQYELGYLMMMKSKYGPGGEFDPDWKPLMAPGAPPPPPPFDIPPPRRPAWRTRRRSSEDISPPRRPAWLAPRRPKEGEATPLVPDRESPGLFGPRSPRDSFSD